MRGARAKREFRSCAGAIRSESLRLLQAHQGYKHIRRMVLELQGARKPRQHLR